MRALLLLLLPGLAGCHFATAAAPPLLGAEAASVMLFHRTLGDIVVSLASGRDCSLVRLDRGQTYCRPPDPPAATLVCTRSLGVADCWADPAPLVGNARPLADSGPVHDR